MVSFVCKKNRCSFAAGQVSLQFKKIWSNLNLINEIYLNFQLLEAVFSSPQSINSYNEELLLLMEKTSQELQKRNKFLIANISSSLQGFLSFFGAGE